MSTRSVPVADEREQPRADERRFASAFGHASVGMLLTSVDGRILEANAAFARLLGYTKEELSNVPFASLTHPDDMEASRAAVARLQAGEESLQFEKRYLTKDGRAIWTHVTSALVRDESGAPVEFVTIVQDMSARRAADERFHLVSRATNDTIWDWDLLSNALWWNDNFTTMFGYGLPELEPTIESWTNRIHAEDLTRVKAGILAAIDRGDRMWQDEYRFRRKSGQYAHILDRGFIIRDASGKGIRMVGSMMDVSARRSAEAELHRVKHNLELIINSAGEGVYGVDATGVTTFINEAGLKMLGLTREEAVGVRLHPIIHHTHPDGRPHPAPECPIYQAAHGGPAATVKDDVFWAKDGTAVPVEYITAPIQEAGRTVGAVTIFKDVTEVHRSERELQRVKHNLESILDSAGEGIYGVDATGITTFINETGLKMLGLTREEAVGVRLHPVIHHTHADGSPHPATQCPIYQAAHGSPGSVVKDDVFWRKDGTAVPVEYVVEPLVENGTTIGAVTVFKDVTDRRRAEDALKASGERTSAILESISDAFFALDKEWRFTYVNRQAEILLGRSQEELLGKGIWVEYADALGTPFEHNYRAAVAERVPKQFETYYPRLENWYDVRAYPSPDGLSVYFQNVTQRKLAEQQIEESRERLEIAVKAANLGTWDLDLIRDTAHRSRRHDEIFGFPEGTTEWSQARFFSHVVPEDRPLVEQAFQEAIASGRLSFESRIHRASGALAWVSVQGAVVYQDGRPSRMLGVVADITERVEAKEAVEKERTLLTTILQQLPAGVVVAEAPSGRMIIANDRVNEILRHDFRPAAGLEQYAGYLAFAPDGRALRPEELPLTRAMAHGEVVTGEEIHYQTGEGRRIPLLANAAPVRNGRGDIAAAVSAFIDISDIKAAEAELRRNADLLSWQRRVLESIATGTPLHATLDTLCREAEIQSPGHHFTVLLVDDEGEHLRHGAAPGLPDHYNRAVDGIAIGEGIGSCGTAAFRREPVIVSDIATDPLWKEFKGLALPIGLRACWSTPIFASDGRLLGTWAVYRSAPGDPAPAEKEMVSVATRLASVAIERAQSEAELRYQRDLTSTITDNAGAALFMMDTRGYPIFMNAAASKMTGYESIEEINERPLHEAVHFRKPDGSHYPMEECPIDRANTEVRVLKDQREIFCRKDGSLFPVEFNVAPVERDGQRLGAVIEVRDITERVRAETALREQADTLDTLNRINQQLAGELELDALLQAVTDAATRVTGAKFGAFFYNAINERGESYLLYNVSGVPREAFSKFPMPRVTAIFGPTFRGEGIVRSDDITKDARYGKNPPHAGMPTGHLAVRSYLAVPVISRGGKVLGGLFFGHPEPGVFAPKAEDLAAGIAAQAAIALDNASLFKAARERAEDLTKLTDALTRSNKELDQFAYITSHDLKAPLRGIANLSRWIEEDMGARLSEESRGHLELMRGRVHRMEALIDAILDYSRAGRVKTQSETIDTAALVADVVDLLAPPEGMRVEVEGPLPTLRSPRMPLQQVFMNLIGNAAKHHHRKTDGTIRVRAEDAGSRWMFTVSDDGPGIAPRFHEKIFAIFQTLEARDKVEGTGIGLALVKKVVESHGGTITLDSDVGRGASFQFTWPKDVA